MNVGVPAAKDSRDSILREQDSDVLYTWRLQAVKMMEEITDVLNERRYAPHYPKGGTGDGDAER